MEAEGENWCEISSGWDLKLKASTAFCRHAAAADRTTVELWKLVFKNTTKKFNPDASLRANKTDNEKIFQSVSISVTRSEFNSELCFHDEVLRMTRGVKLLSSDGPAAAEPPDTTWTWWFVSESAVTEDESLLENTDNFTSVQQNYVRSRVTSVCGLKLNHHRYESFIDTKRLFTSSPCILQTAEIKGTICEICAEF